MNVVQVLEWREKETVSRKPVSKGRRQPCELLSGSGMRQVNISPTIADCLLSMSIAMPSQGNQGL